MTETIYLEKEFFDKYVEILHEALEGYDDIFDDFRYFNNILNDEEEEEDEDDRLYWTYNDDKIFTYINEDVAADRKLNLRLLEKNCVYMKSINILIREYKHNLFTDFHAESFITFYGRDRRQQEKAKLRDCENFVRFLMEKQKKYIAVNQFLCHDIASEIISFL